MFCSNSAVAAWNQVPSDLDELESLRSAGLISETQAAQWAAWFAEPVDINLCSRETLAALPLMTPGLADAVIAARPYLSLDALAEQAAVPHDLVESLRPLLRVASAAPSARAAVTTLWRPGDGAQTYLQARGEAWNGWRSAAWASMVGQGAQPTLMGAHVRGPLGGAALIVGSYSAGFGERITFDNSAQAAPAGWYERAPVVEDFAHGRLRARPGLWGAALSWPPRQAAMGPAVTAFVGRVAASATPAQWLGGAHGAYQWDRRTHVGGTAYAARSPGPTPTGDSGVLGVLGLEAAWGLGAVDVATEYAQQYQGGDAWVLRGVWAPAPWSVATLAYRAYGQDYNNPFNRGTAAADSYRGQRARNERGLRADWQVIRPRWIASTRSDLWAPMEAGVTRLPQWRLSQGVTQRLGRRMWWRPRLDVWRRDTSQPWGWGLGGSLGLAPVHPVELSLSGAWRSPHDETKQGTWRAGVRGRARWDNVASVGTYLGGHGSLHRAQPRWHGFVDARGELAGWLHAGSRFGMQQDLRGHWRKTLKVFVEGRYD